MATRKLEVVITGDAKQLEKTLGRVGNQASGFGSAMKKAALPATAALAAVAVGAKKTIDAASELDEQVNKTAVVFGKNGKEIHKWSRGLTKNFGLSQRAALEAAGTYGNMLKPMGILPAKTKEISTRMVELAGDMASFNNASPEETLDALRAGLAGETEPLRRFGVFLNEAAIQAEAVSSGIVKLDIDTTKLKQTQLAAEAAQQRYTDAVKEHGLQSKEAQRAAVAMEVAENRVAKATAGTVPKLDAAQKALATYNIISRSTADAQGDFARTSDSVANQQRIQAAETENLNAKIGKGLLPVYRTLQQVVLRMTTLLSEHTTATKIAVGVIAGLAAGVLAVNAGLAVYRAATVAATAAQVAFNVALSANPIGLVVIALAALAAGTVVAYKKSETFRNIVDGLWSKLKALGGWIKENWGKISAVIEKAPMVLVFKAMANAVDDIVDGIRWLGSNAERLLGPVASVLGKVGSILPGRGDSSAAAATHPAPAGVNLMGASPVMAPFAAAAAAHGLQVTSGLRPGAITANGTPSDHGIGKALDVSNGYNTPQMAAFFRSLIGNPSVKQAFYDPLGSIFGGKWSSYREGGHTDHVHVATYDRGGDLLPGWTLAYNGTGRAERVVGPGGDGPYYLVLPDGKVLAELVRKEDAAYARVNG